jgi:toxin HigB-1
LKYIFDNKNLQELYEKGISRKYKIDDNVKKKFFMRIQQIEASVDINDLCKAPSLCFEKLEGYDNRYSIRLNKKWRLEFNIKRENEISGDVIILELSNHYQ